MEFNELIAEFATRHDVEGLEAKDDAASLDIDGIIVNIVCNEGMVTFSADIGEPPVEGIATFANLLLEANLQSDAFFAREAETGVYLLLRRIALPMLSNDGFDTAIEAFVNQIEIWRQLLINFRPAAQAAAEASEAESSSFGVDGFIQV